LTEQLGNTPPGTISVLAELKRRLAQYKRAGLGDNLDTNVLQRVIERGRTFTRIEKPKGFRWLKEKQCFNNSLTTVLNKGLDMPHLRYVEGYLLSEFGPIHHGWVTLDGVHAIDLTLREESFGYYGVIVPTKQACKLMMSGKRVLPALHALAAKDLGIDPAILSG
jgi:hypothetical protein